MKRRLSKRRRIILSWLVVAIWAALIFLFSAQPSLSTGLGAWDYLARKLAHMGEFGVLWLLVWHALKEHGLGKGKALVIAALAAVAYAASDEFHQSFVSGRNASVKDVAIDCGGIAVAIIFFFFFQRYRRLRVAAG